MITVVVHPTFVNHVEGPQQSTIFIHIKGHCDVAKCYGKMQKHHYNFTVVNQRRFTPQHLSNNQQTANKRSMTSWQGDDITIWQGYDNMTWYDKGTRLWRGCHLTTRWPVSSGGGGPRPVTSLRMLRSGYSGDSGKCKCCLIVESSAQSQYHMRVIETFLKLAGLLPESVMRQCG